MHPYILCNIWRIGNLNFISRPLRFRVFKKLPTDLDFKVEIFGYKYAGNLNNFIGKSIFLFRAHERELLEFLKKFIRNKTVVYYGVNFGHYLLFYSRFAKSVIYIEPDI